MLEFDSIDFNEEPVRIAGKDYVLTEPSEETSRVCNNALMEGIEGFEIKGKNKGQVISKAHNIADADSLMVSRCLFLLVGNGRDPVPLGTVRGWPRRIVRELAEAARRLGGEKEDDDEDDDGDEAKNSPSATTTGSE